MSGEKDLEQLKKEAVAKAKAAAAAKRKAMAEGASTPVSDGGDLAKQKAEAAAKARAAAFAKDKQADAPVKEPADDLAKKKAAAVAKAKAAAAAKRKAMGMEPAQETEPVAPVTETESGAGDDVDDLAKKKAAAVAKAKAAAAAKRKAMGDEPVEETSAGDDVDDLAKKKAAAVAKAKAAAAAKMKAKAVGSEAPVGDDEKAKAIAAAKAKAKAAAAAKAKAAGGTAAPVDETPSAPSVNQPFLDKYRKVIEDHLGSDVLEDSYINKLSKDVPTIVAKRDTYFKVAQFLKYNELLGFDYLSELHGTDFQTHMEVYVHLFSYKNRQSVALKVKIDRDEPIIESLEPLWAGANWPECEAYDLLGIKFTGHPNLHRILLGEDWVGYPLRKDYEPYDVEV
ncbi:NADH-quinone oxidoreductase subunit C [Neobacillus sp. FSL H8-0543]|uniref:NADH-quinone oxidoreductase subunit C n=1 Tax=Neobacillus sp. FSL H8-0543 TaxID=2954672 RepID=UPI0031594E6A